MAQIMFGVAARQSASVAPNRTFDFVNKVDVLLFHWSHGDVLPLWGMGQSSNMVSTFEEHVRDHQKYAGNERLSPCLWKFDCNLGEVDVQLLHFWQEVPASS